MRSLCVCVLLAVGCGGAQTANRKDAEPNIAVLSPGTEPRRLVRYELTAGTQRFEVTTKLQSKLQYTNTVLEQGERNLDLPGLRTTLRLDTSQPDPSGTARVTATIEDMVALGDVIDPAMQGAMARPLAQAAGTRMSWTLDQRGTLSDAQLDRDTGSRAMRQAFDRMQTVLRLGSVVFPAIPIGVGAAWSVRSRALVEGAKWDVEITYQLRELTSTSATLEVTTVMTAGSQPLSVEPNRSTRMTSGRAHTSSQVHVSLQQPFATGASHSTSETNLSIVDRKLRVTATLLTESSIESRRVGQEPETPAGTTPSTPTAESPTVPAQPPSP